MKTLKAYLRFLAAAFAVNVKSVVEYRANFLAQTFGMMLNNAAFAVFWKVLLDRTGGLGGYGFADVMFVWAIVSTSFGLAHVVFGNVRGLSEIIREGDLDAYLLQPKDVWLNVLASRTEPSAWGDFAYGFVVLAFLPGISPERVALFCILALAAAAVFTACFALMESLAFFMGDSTALSGALTEFLLSFSLYPETVFDPGMRWIFYTIVPSGFIAFVPLAAFRSLDWRLVPIAIGAAAAYVALSRAVFNAGLRRYESGNKIGTKV
ncbi:MAG: ABC-2 family transporter protein [Spirochaetes bacterium]|nr:ABC-2 family transporter protein [Spirochaetota bacterium]